MMTAENIHKKFSKPVLNGVTIKANPGEIIGIAGENGSGKSTLLSIIAGLTMADTGEININGQIGYVPQENALFDNLSVKDNLRFWYAAYGITSKSLHFAPHNSPFKPPFNPLFNPLFNSLFNFMDDKDFLKKKVRHLSGGMKKRLSIALACLHGPKWLLMDEPSSALDIGFKGALYNIMENICREEGAVIFTTHQPDELLWCNRIYVLRDGLFIYEGAPKDLEELSEMLYR